MRLIIAAILILFIRCNTSSSKEVSSCERGSLNKFIPQSPATKEIDTISKRFHNYIFEKYAAYDYSKECRDSTKTAILYNLLSESDLLNSDKILSIEILPKQEETVACEPFLYREKSDSLSKRIFETSDTILYCRRSYSYPSRPPLQISWKFYEPLTANYRKYKLLEILHRSLKHEHGSTLITRIWYKDL